MSMNLRYPKITGPTEKEQLAQIKSYLHQFVEQQAQYAAGPHFADAHGGKQEPVAVRYAVSVLQHKGDDDRVAEDGVQHPDPLVSAA